MASLDARANTGKGYYGSDLATICLVCVGQPRITLRSPDHLTIIKHLVVILSVDILNYEQLF
jgi:hypothetical protein